MELMLGEGENVLGEAVKEVVGEDDEGIFEGAVGLVGEVEVEGLVLLGVEVGDVQDALLEVGLQEGVGAPVVQGAG